MRKQLAVLGLTLVASAALADEKSFRGDNATAVRWRDIVGVITAQGVDNPATPKIDSGTFAWSTTGGQARVDMASGMASFDVEGLVINGTQFTGTTGPVSAVTGTLVCNPGTDTEMALDTPAVPLSARGNAMFAGPLAAIPATCANPLFLVRIAVPTGAAGRWIATGAVRQMGSALQ
jgi:hypothetical protein